MGRQRAEVVGSFMKREKRSREREREREAVCVHVGERKKNMGAGLCVRA